LYNTKEFDATIIISGGSFMEVSTKALELFDSGYNCAESVLLAVNNELNRSNPGCFPRIATGFGGGIARNGGLCGALTGGIMALGLALGRNDNQGSREPCYPAVDSLYNGFIENFGSPQCRNLIEVDLKTPEGQKTHAQKEVKRICRNCVKWSAGKAMELIAQFSSGTSLNA
jgi:C_GCAxxG_C_C family probable redox protein